VSVKVGNGVLVTQQPDATGMFKVTVPENKSSGLRFAVISVTDSCMNESQDFIFAQEAGGCQVPATPGGISGNQTVCAISTGNLTIEAQTYTIDEVPGATGYTWTVPAGWTGGGSSIDPTITVTPGASAANGNITVTADNNCGSSEQSVLPVTVSKFTQGNPGATLSICKGATQNLNPTAASGIPGSTYSYQWQQSSDNQNWENATGTSTNQAYPIPTAVAGSMYYRRQATASLCSGTITSTADLVTVYDGITQGDPSSITICDGTTTTFNLAAAIGVNPTYVWQQSSDNQNWVTATGGSSATLAPYTTPVLTSNMYYRRRATACGVTITSNSALVTTDPALGSISGKTYVPKSTANLTYSVNNVSDATYVWTVSGSLSLYSGQGNNAIIVNANSTAGIGTISVAVNNGKCTATRTLEVTVGCGAYVSSKTDWREFMCWDLGADYNADPFTPAQALYGNIYKWGIKDAVLSAAEDQTTTTANNNGFGGAWGTAAYGGTPPPTTGADWNMNTANPCPEGFRIPTQAEWAGVLANNAYPKQIGDVATSPTNFNSGVIIGQLYLPCTGYRDGSNDGRLVARGTYSYYWSSNSSTTGAISVFMGVAMPNSNNATTPNTGMSIRCIANN